MDSSTLNARRKLTIYCTPDDGVVIEDGNGKKGGHVRAKGGRALSWKNSTEQSVCYVRFTLIPDEGTEEPVGSDWPFDGDPPPELLLEVPQGGWATGTLKVVQTTESFDYVVLGADKTPLMDPVIIIDPN